MATGKVECAFFPRQPVDHKPCFGDFRIETDLRPKTARADIGKERLHVCLVHVLNFRLGDVAPDRVRIDRAVVLLVGELDPGRVAIGKWKAVDERRAIDQPDVRRALLLDRSARRVR